jgi:signal transduction histidine kinase
MAFVVGQAADVAIAVGLTAVGFAALRFADAPAGGRAADGLAYVLAAVISLPLAVRRWSPLGVLAVVMAGSLVYASRGYPEVSVDFFGPAIAYYTVASQTPRRTAILAAAFVWAAVAVSLVISPLDGNDEATALTSAVVILAIWLFGDSVRQRREYASQLETRTRELADARTELAEQAVIQERVRIARDLHDVVAHNISSLVVQASVARDAIGTNQDAAVAAIENVQSLSRGALGEIRQLLGVLRHTDEGPARSAPAPGLADIAGLVAQAQAGGISVETSIELPASPLPASVDLAAYRIIQEALTNVMKHAAGSAARVSVQNTPEGLEIEIINDTTVGPGNEASERPGGSGLGIVGMRERVALLGGSFSAGPREVGGFRVAALLPLSSKP